MKQITFPQLSFLMLLYMKATGALAFGHPVPWAVVFLPFLLHLAGLAYNLYFINTSIVQRILYKVWKLKLNRRINEAAKSARNNSLNNLKAGNPGQFTDPANFGK